MMNCVYFLLFYVIIIVSNTCIIYLICFAVHTLHIGNCNTAHQYATNLQICLNWWVNRAVYILDTFLYVNDYDDLLVVVV